MISNTALLYSTQISSSSMDSSDCDASPLSVSINVAQCGPIQARLSRKPIPTLETGRRSKHLVLVGDEAAKREKRRERNRDAARKLKEKRQVIEEELNKKLQELKSEHDSLQGYLRSLHQRKQNLQNEVENLLIDPIIELLSNDNEEFPLFFEQYADDMDLSEESIEYILNFDINPNFNSSVHN